MSGFSLGLGNFTDPSILMYLRPIDNIHQTEMIKLAKWLTSCGKFSNCNNALHYLYFLLDEQPMRLRTILYNFYYKMKAPPINVDNYNSDIGAVRSHAKRPMRQYGELWMDLAK